MSSDSTRGCTGSPGETGPASGPTRAETRAASPGTNGSSSAAITRSVPTSGASTAQRRIETGVVAQQRPRMGGLHVTVGGVDQRHNGLGGAPQVEASERGVDPGPGLVTLRGKLGVSRCDDRLPPEGARGERRRTLHEIADAVREITVGTLDETGFGEVGFADPRDLAAQPPPQRIRAVARDQLGRVDRVAQ